MQVDSLAQLKHDDFSKHIKEKFVVRDVGVDFFIELIEVKQLYRAIKKGGRDQFSLLFKAADEILLPQKMYHLDHEEMGVLNIFLVPIGHERPEEQGSQAFYLYEAIFT
ncbi:DUF6916 family protein [Zooshikella harenae]|uniref:DUF6916 domain-containing protein n=1 Tax=Zooshikella harenae TaxID=2827238 RepID=A0ABS5ZHQ8_9GAMM|nr:hypothetical protein [Zooshikella harenae]MBU2713465.1 hypothetical protein [Zooshikella harenae]